MPNLAKVGRATERRGNARLACRVPLRVYPDGFSDEYFTLACRDVTPGGAFVASDLLFDVGELLDIELPIPGRKRLVRTQARIARVNARPTRPGMALAFGALNAQDRVALAQIVARSEPFEDLPA